MLFEPQGAALVADMFRGALYALNRDRKRDAAKRLDFYHDGQLEHLQALLASKFADPKRLTPCFVNVVRKVIDLKARVYADEPKRTVNGTKADKALFAEIAEQAALSIKMKTASKCVKLLKTCLIRPVWRNGRLDLDILTPDILDVTTGESPEDIQAVLVTHYPDNGKTEEVSYALWTPETWQRLDYRENQTDGGPNPYGVLPFVPLWDRAPTDAFWLAGGDDLIVMQMAVNKALVDLLATLEFQGFGLGWIKTATSERGGIIEAGPGKMIEIPLGGDIGFASPQAPIDEVVNAIDRLMKWAAVSNGLPGSSMSVDPTDESGISKIVGNVELEESRRDDIALWRAYERRLFSMVRTVWNHHNPGRKLSDAATLAVDFTDPKPETSLREQAETWDTLIRTGLISPVDAVMERNPDIATREDALAHLLNVKDEIEILSAASRTLSPWKPRPGLTLEEINSPPQA